MTTFIQKHFIYLTKNMLFLRVNMPSNVSLFQTSKNTYHTSIKHPLLQAAQDLRAPSGSFFSNTSENNTERNKATSVISMFQEFVHFI